MRGISAWIRRSVAKKLFKKQKGKCFYCGIDMHLDEKRDSTRMTLDHLTPKSKGGKAVASNFVGACHGCNLKRGNKSIAEFVGVKKPKPPEVCKCEAPIVKRRVGNRYTCSVCNKSYQFRSEAS